MAVIHIQMWWKQLEVSFLFVWQKQTHISSTQWILQFQQTPKLLTMYGIGFSYNHNEDTLQVEDSPTRLEPPRSQQGNLAASISRDLQRDFLPNVTPIAPNNS